MMFMIKSLFFLYLFNILAGSAKIFDISSLRHNINIPLNRLKDNIPQSITRKDICTVTSRIPKAIVKSIKTSTKSFITSSAVLFPVGMIINANRPRPIDAWLMRGAATGIEWAKIGAYYAV